MPAIKPRIKPIHLELAGHNNIGLLYAKADVGGVQRIQLLRWKSGEDEGDDKNSRAETKQTRHFHDTHML